MVNTAGICVSIGHDSLENVTYAVELYGEKNKDILCLERSLYVSELYKSP